MQAKGLQMEFDYKEYAEALDEFLVKMEAVPRPDHPDANDAVSRVCKALRIARIDILTTESFEDQLQDSVVSGAIYRDGDQEDHHDESREAVYREMAENGNIIVYKVYPYLGAEDWSEVEKDKIAVLVKALFVYHGRRKIMSIAEKLIYRDPSLNVYNLTYFTKSCAEKMKNGSITEYGAAYFNLKRFSMVNQQLGRERATMVMSMFVDQLGELLDKDEVISRIGSDNFAVLFRKEKLNQVIDHLRGRWMEYDEEEELLFISATAGYYLISEKVKQPSDIMDNACIAYNMAKNVNNEAYAIYNDKTAEKIKENKAIEESFTDALQNGEFEVYYQPKVALKNYTLAGAEALCRWFHDGRMISPGNFIPVFEQSKAITLLDFYIFEHVCRDLRRWISAGKKVVKVSVNFSRRHLGNKDLVQQILSVIDRYEVPHEYIEIELTETTTDVDFKDLRKVVTELQAAGVSTSVDDFGMGYSSLNLIKELPWNVLKIDKSFLDPVADGDKAGCVMLCHVISMAQEMGLECIVEGVETAEQVKFLKQHNCYLAQGFFFDKPLKKSDFEERLAAIQI